MKAALLTTLLVLFICTCVPAQNLVPNPSFEKIVGLPIKNTNYGNFPFERQSGNVAYKRHRGGVKITARL